MAEKSALLRILNEEIVACRKCPRLVEYREKVAREKRRAFRDWTYWGKPVPGFGDLGADLLILGLAPAAHGANRTGRVFTGDRSPPTKLLARARDRLRCHSLASSYRQRFRESDIGLHPPQITITASVYQKVWLPGQDSNLQPIG